MISWSLPGIIFGFRNAATNRRTWAAKVRETISRPRAAETPTCQPPAAEPRASPSAMASSDQGATLRTSSRSGSGAVVMGPSVMQVDEVDAQGHTHEHEDGGEDLRRMQEMVDRGPGAPPQQQARQDVAHDGVADRHPSPGVVVGGRGGHEPGEYIGGPERASKEPDSSSQVEGHSS